MPQHASKAGNSYDFSPSPVDLKSLPRNLFTDQKAFWSTPFRMTSAQWQWTVPLAFVGAGLLASDTAIEKHVPTNPSTVSHAVTLSNAGVAALAGVGGGMFLLGHITHDDQQRETGLLGRRSRYRCVPGYDCIQICIRTATAFHRKWARPFFSGRRLLPIATRRSKLGDCQRDRPRISRAR